MDKSNPTFLGFRAYWQLSEEMIADVAKERLAEIAEDQGRTEVMTVKRS